MLKHIFRSGRDIIKDIQLTHKYDKRYFVSIQLPNVIQRPRSTNLVQCKRQKSEYLTYESKLVLPLFLQISQYEDRKAILDQHGSYTFKELFITSNKLANYLLNSRELNNKTVPFICPSDVSYVCTLLAIWFAGGIAVPLCPNHPVSELKYLVSDSCASLVVCSSMYESKMNEVLSGTSIDVLNINICNYEMTIQEKEIQEKISIDQLDKIDEQMSDRLNQAHLICKQNGFADKEALIIYTSGTTGRPKGVVHTYGSLFANVLSMILAWQWSEEDVILHVLPLHHVHGVINALMTPLYCGAACIMLPEFDAAKVWKYLMNPVKDLDLKFISVFMAVPTIYAKLLEYFEKQYQRGREARKAKESVNEFFKTHFRLMVSGSSALPTPLLQKWEKLTGHRLLERYGMTETLMVLTNPLKGTRWPGFVGNPFENVKVLIAKPNVSSENGYDIVVQGNHKRTTVNEELRGEQGELYIKGPHLFKEYLNKPEVTAESFTNDGWFKTGDTACFENNNYKILGRTSVDIIKSGGYKISALDIEKHLLEHPGIVDVAIVGTPDMTWGQRVSALIVPKSEPIELNELKEWAQDRMPKYHIPSLVKNVEIMPRNIMGKVNKKAILSEYFGDEMKKVK